jgi:hypothetical protein
MPVILFFRLIQLKTWVVLGVVKPGYELQFKPTMVFLLCIFIP